MASDDGCEMNPLLAKAIAKFPLPQAKGLPEGEKYTVADIRVIHAALAKLFEETVRECAKTMCVDCRNDVPMMNIDWHIHTTTDYRVPCDASKILALLET